MNAFTKGLTLLLGAIAVLACIATVGIIGYSAVHGNDNKAVSSSASSNSGVTDPDPISAMLAAVPTSTPEIDPETDTEPQPAVSEHIHEYKELVIKEASCTEAGLVRYTCSCGDSYEVDILSLGHLQDDEWELVRTATDTQSGLRIKRCIRCGETLVSETIPSTGGGSVTTVSEDGTVVAATPHNHLYVATTEREATCTLAGLRKLTCSCGDFYTEMIPALGHVASDWEEAEAPTATQSGTSQRVCKVCGALLDIKVLPKLSPSPSASASSGAGSSPAPASGSPASSPGTSSSPGTKASAAPSPTPHVHNFVSYMLVPATCTEKGIRSFVCSCGASYAESIELDLNNHKFRATFVAPTETQQGYTIYTCERCNYSYMDNYILPLNPGAAAAAAALQASPSPSASSGTG